MANLNNLITEASELLTQRPIRPMTRYTHLIVGSLLERLFYINTRPGVGWEVVNDRSQNIHRAEQRDWSSNIPYRTMILYYDRLRRGHDDSAVGLYYSERFTSDREWSFLMYPHDSSPSLQNPKVVFKSTLGLQSTVIVKQVGGEPFSSSKEWPADKIIEAFIEDFKSNV